MNEWFTTQQLAGMSGLPGTERAIQIRAKNAGWQSRPRAVGKGNEYHISSLPADTQRAIRISQAKTAASAAKAALPDLALCKDERLQRREASLARYRKLSANLQRVIDARLELLDAARAFHATSGLPKGEAWAEFSRLYKAEEISVEPWVREAQPGCSRPRLYDWEKALNEQGLDAVAGDKGAGRRGTGTIDSQPELRNYIIGMVVGHPHIKYATLAKACAAEFAGTSISLPGSRTLERWCNQWKDENRQVFTAVTNPDAWKNKYMDAQGSASEHVIGLNQLWEFDSTPADLMLTDGRHTILGVIDVYSRRTSFVVMPTSDSKGVAKVIRRAILSWGVPETAKTDNGADYKSKWIKHVFRALGVNQEFCPPFQGWKKPHIERVFRTFAHDIAELLPGFIGHNVAERKAIEARKSFSDRLFKKDQLIDVSMSSADLQQFCNDWLEYEYHARKHESLGCSPNDMVASYHGSIRTVSDERLLDVLLSEPAGTRTVTKTGIKLNGGVYVHPQLAAHTGEQVSAFYDDADMGRIYVHDLDGEFICIAEDPAITGVSRTEVAAQAKVIQKETIQEERRRLKAAAAQVTKRDVAQQILQHRADEERARKVRHFPRPETEHNSDGLAAAAAALKAQTAAGLPGWFNKEAAMAALNEQPAAAPRQLASVVKAQFNKTEGNRGLTVPNDIAQRYQFWLSINQKTQEGTATEEEMKWANAFKGSPAWDSGKMLLEMRQQAAAQ